MVLVKKIRTRLSHVDAQGHPRMVDVGAKKATARHAVAQAIVRFPADVARVLRLYGADVVFSAAGLGPLVEIWYRLKKWIFDPYRPELHYMRGPGPKWREKHAHGGLSRSMSHQQEDCTSAEQDLRRTPAAIATSRADLCRSPNPKEEVGLQHPI